MVWNQVDSRGQPFLTLTPALKAQLWEAPRGGLGLETRSQVAMGWGGLGDWCQDLTQRENLSLSLTVE